jgi:hypothetical protein
MTTSTPTRPLKQQIKSSLQDLTTLRDEVRLQIHLAGMEAKQNWEQILEPQIKDTGRLAQEASAITQKAIEDLVKRVRGFRDEHTPKH